MIHRNFITCIILLFAAHITWGQTISRSVIATTGDYSTSGSGSLSSTTGEVMVETYTNNNLHLTQGFQQPTMATDTSGGGDDSTGIRESIAGGEISIYPNPVVNNLHVQITGNTDKTYKILLVDVLGRTVKDFGTPAHKVQGQATYRLKMNDLSPGMYFLQIRSTDKTEQKVFKINKVNY